MLLTSSTVWLVPVRLVHTLSRSSTTRLSTTTAIKAKAPARTRVAETDVGRRITRKRWVLTCSCRKGQVADPQGRPPGEAQDCQGPRAQEGAIHPPLRQRHSHQRQAQGRPLQSPACFFEAGRTFWADCTSTHADEPQPRRRINRLAVFWRSRPRDVL